MDIEILLERYYAHQKKLFTLYGVSALLGWDQEANLPSAAVDTRAQQSSLLAGIIHRHEVDHDYFDIVNQLWENKDNLSDQDVRSISLAKKSLDKQTALSQEFVEEFGKVKSEAQSVWVQAKKNNDYEQFAPYLQKIIDMSRRYAELVSPDQDPYDVLLDEYEEGADQELYDRVLLPLSEPIGRLIKQHTGATQDSSYSIAIDDRPTFKSFVEELCEQVGFDFERGLIGEVHHPFATNLGPGDQRINLRYDNLLETVFAIIHELGHGLYEMHTNPLYDWTNLSGGVSLGVHESQSRLLENVIGRSEAFLGFFLKELQDRFPQFAGWSVDGVYKYVIHVVPGLIRVASDELTYNQHILLRYEIEKGLMNGSISVDKLPKVRNEKMETYLGVVPDSDSDGCLQDVHRSLGLIGYFPTYMLGNIIGLQLRDRFVQDYPGWEGPVAAGNFTDYINRFSENVWQYGSRYTPTQLIEHVSGSELQASYFLDYLEEKYT